MVLADTGSGLPEGRPRGPRTGRFLRFCQVERRLAAETCRAYERDVSACLTFLRNDSLTLLDVRTADLRRFLADETKRRPAPSSQARTVGALKCFFRFCAENEYLDRDPAAVLRTPKKREALPDVLDLGELRRLLAVTETRRNLEAKPPGKASARPPPPRPYCLRRAAALGTAGPRLG